MSKMTSFREWPLDCKVYIGNLGNEANERELEDAFSRYGAVKQCWIARNPAGFAFILMDDPRDASDATRGLDGSRLCGRRVKVEMSTGRPRARNGRGGGGGGGGYRGEREDMRYGGGGGGGSGGRYSPQPRGGRRGYSRSRSRSRERYMRDRRSRSRSRDRYERMDRMDRMDRRGGYDDMNGRRSPRD